MRRGDYTWWIWERGLDCVPGLHCQAHSSTTTGFCFVIYLFIIIIFKHLFYLFILAVPGLSCSTQDLCCSMRDLLVVACRLLSCGMHVGSVPLLGIEPKPPTLGAWSLTHWTTREVPPLGFGTSSWAHEVF